jgi:esterase/lipase superfamily enzyme
MIDVYARKDRGATVTFMDEQLYSEHILNRIDSNEIYEDDVVVNVHGYRADEARVTKSFGTLEGNYISLGVNAKQIGFWWPASWSTTVGFITARARSARAAKYLVTLLWQLRGRKCNVVLQGHSMGCKVILDAFYEMRRLALHDHISGTVLTAPAIPNNYFDKIDVQAAEWYGCHKVFYSYKDPVLKLAYRLVPGNWSSPAMGTTGPRPYEKIVKYFDCSQSVSTHSGYRDLSLLYKEVKQSLVSTI